MQSHSAGEADRIDRVGVDGASAVTAGAVVGVAFVDVAVAGNVGVVGAAVRVAHGDSPGVVVPGDARAPSPLPPPSCCR